MTTPDAQARTLSEAIERQRRQRDVARESAKAIERDQRSESDSESEREPE